VGQPYIGEIRMFAGSFAPAGWAFCNGALMPISENDALFTLIGTTYGGDGQETFGLPDLQGRLPMHAGQGPGLSQSYQLGEKGGVESVTLSTQQLPIHNHAMLGSTDTAVTSVPTANVIGKSTAIDLFVNAVPGDPLNNQAVTPTGGSQPHENLQPYLCISFIISLYGVFPQQT
jgi:microcystin-dependent protein